MISRDGRYYWDGSEWVQMPSDPLAGLDPDRETNWLAILIVIVVGLLVMVGVVYYLLSQ